MKLVISSDTKEEAITLSNEYAKALVIIMSFIYLSASSTKVERKLALEVIKAMHSVTQ